MNVFKIKNLFFFVLISGLFFTACQSELTKKETQTPEFTTQYFVDKSGKKQGLETKMDAKTNKLVQETPYKDDLIEGEDRFFYPSGKVQELHTYKNGVQDGVFQTFYENGVLRTEGTYVKGLMQGIYKRFYDNKQVRESVTFVDNFEKGAFKEFYANGKPSAEGTYVYDTVSETAVENGELIEYDSLGNVTHKMCESGFCHTIK